MKLTKGANLSPEQIAEVKRAFIYRHTIEHQSAYRGESGQRTQTDAEWIAAHAFYIRRDGRLSQAIQHARCEPHYLAD
jgi:hypothetical protein